MSQDSVQGFETILAAACTRRHDATHREGVKSWQPTRVPCAMRAAEEIIVSTPLPRGDSVRRLAAISTS